MSYKGQGHAITFTCTKRHCKSEHLTRYTSEQRTHSLLCFYIRSFTKKATECLLVQ